MRRILSSILMLVSVVSFAQTADEVIASHIAARGGAEKLSAVKSVKMESNMAVAGMELPVKMCIVNGVGTRMDLNAMGSDMTTVVDSTGGWAINPMAGGTDPIKGTAADLKGALVQLDLSNGLLDYKTKGSTVELQGKEAVGGADAFKLKLTLKNGAAITHFIDAKSYNLVKTVAVANLGGQEFEATTSYSNFKAVDGIVFPFMNEVSHPQFGSMATTLTKIEVNPTIDPAVFAFPKK